MVEPAIDDETGEPVGVGLAALDNGVTAEEAARLVELDHPTQASLQRAGVVVQLVAVQAVAHLETEGVASAEADGNDVVRGSLLQDGVPELLQLAQRAAGSEKCWNARHAPRKPSLPA